VWHIHRGVAFPGNKEVSEPAMSCWLRPSTAKIAVFCLVIAALEVMFPLALVLQEALWCIARSRWDMGGSAEGS
jgi:hypothetical protein